MARALGPIPSDNQQAFQIFVVPETGPQEEATSTLVRKLRETTIPDAVADSGLDVKVTGAVALSVDFSDYLSARLPVFFSAVLSLSFLLLMMVFRSILVPLRAVIMNLLSRVREEYDRTGDAKKSVADGLAATARVITAAAAIMVVVFGSFVLADARVIKMFGLGLASAVFLDATLVRMLLVPATMELLGEKNWWLPKWLDRILPTLNVEGGYDKQAEPEPERELVDAS